MRGTRILQRAVLRFMRIRCGEALIGIGLVNAWRWCTALAIRRNRLVLLTDQPRQFGERIAWRRLR